MIRTLLKVQRRSLAVEDVMSRERLAVCSVPVDRSAHGVSVVKDEQRCGMVASVENMVRHEAVIKCLDSDWQANELDRFGNVTVLGSRPRGLWKKISPAELMMIEDSSDESFSNPDKSFTPRTMNAGKYAPVIGRVPKSTPVLQFNMYREAQSMNSVLNRLAYEIKVPEKRVNFIGQNSMSGPASFTEGFGCITNQGAALNVAAEALPRASRRYGVNALLFEPQSYVPLRAEDGLRFGFFVDSQGTSYNLLLRCTSMSRSDAIEMMTSLQRFGFMNYFPISHFSARGIKNHEVAAMVMENNYFNACSVFLQSHADSSVIFNKAFQKYINSSHEESHFFANTMKNTATQLRMSPALVGFLDDLSAKSKDFKQIWDNCPESLRLQYLHASVAFIFNAMASQRCITGGASKIVAGDLIYVTASEYAVDGKFSGFQPAMIEGIFAPSDEVVYVGEASQDDIDNFDIFRVVLPLCNVSETGTEGRTDLQFPTSIATRELHTEFARAHSLGWLLDPSQENSMLMKRSRSGLVGVALSQLHTYRTLLAKPSVDWSTRVETDPNSFSALKTDLFLLQEKKSTDDLRKTQVGATSKASRFRVPSPFNMSPKHRDELSPIVGEHSYKGNQKGDATSVGLSFKLPRGSHALSMLREKIDVTHAHIDDLISL